MTRHHNSTLFDLVSTQHAKKVLQGYKILKINLKSALGFSVTLQDLVTLIILRLILARPLRFIYTGEAWCNSP
jgi:hypothetical protein